MTQMCLIGLWRCGVLAVRHEYNDARAALRCESCGTPGCWRRVMHQFCQAPKGTSRWPGQQQLRLPRTESVREKLVEILNCATNRRTVTNRPGQAVLRAR